MALSESGTDGVNGNPDGNDAQGGWVFPALLAIVLLVAVAIPVGSRWGLEVGGTAKKTGPWSPSAEPQGATVALEIDFGNGARKRIDALPWRTGMNVADLMEAGPRVSPRC